MFTLARRFGASNLPKTPALLGRGDGLFASVILSFTVKLASPVVCLLVRASSAARLRPRQIPSGPLRLPWIPGYHIRDNEENHAANARKSGGVSIDCSWSGATGMLDSVVAQSYLAPRGHSYLTF